MGSSGPSGCECSGACGGVASAAPGYGYDGTAVDGGAGADGTDGHVCASTSAGRDDDGTDD